MASIKVYLEISVNYTVWMAVVYRLQDLLDTVGCISFRVELTGNNIFKQFTTRYPVILRNHHPSPCNKKQFTTRHPVTYTVSFHLSLWSTYLSFWIQLIYIVGLVARSKGIVNLYKWSGTENCTELSLSFEQEWFQFYPCLRKASATPPPYYLFHH